MKKGTRYYFDTSALLPYYREESTSGRAQGLLLKLKPPIFISSLTMVEFASALSRWVRMKELSDSDAGMIEMAFKDDIKNGLFVKLPISANNFKQAENWLLSRHTSLRTLDALHLACAWYNKSTLVTFDAVLQKSAVTLGIKALI